MRILLAASLICLLIADCYWEAGVLCLLDVGYAIAYGLRSSLGLPAREIG